VGFDVGTMIGGCVARMVPISGIVTISLLSATTACTAFGVRAGFVVSPTVAIATRSPRCVQTAIDSPTPLTSRDDNSDLSQQGRDDRRPRGSSGDQVERASERASTSSSADGGSKPYRE
jgi:hypothetical protein